MAWVESASESFLCRHSSGVAEDAERVLDLLERTRDRLDRVFPQTIGDLEVILHDNVPSLVAAVPVLPFVWAATEPGGRRYVTGWAGRHELHVLAPAALRDRASGVTGSAQMLELAPATLYTRRVVVACNPALDRSLAPARSAVALRWAWLLEGAARWFSGESAHARAAVARRLRAGGRPAFPPSIRDAPLLGATVIDLIAREEGERAAAKFTCRLHPRGPRAALRTVFGGRSLVHTEGTWRSHLARLAAA